MGITRIIRQVGRPSKIEEAMAKYAVAISENIKLQQQRKRMVASGESLESHVVIITKPNEVNYEAASYYTFLIDGRGPGGVNMGRIEKWIADRGIVSYQGYSPRQLLFAIADKIANFGTEIGVTRSSLDLDEAIFETEKDYLDEVGDEIAKQVSDAIVDSLTKRPNTEAR